MSLLAVVLLLITLPLRAQSFAISDVTVVDTRTGSLQMHRTVTVRDGRIAAVDVGSPATGIAVIPGTGKFLIPGLWDMVAHLSWSTESALPVLVANGVTAVRDQGGDIGETAGWAQGVRNGQLIGPTIFQVGPMLNGQSFNRYQYALGSPEQARAAVRLLKFEHVDQLEIERRVPNDVYAALIAEAKANGLPLGGKVPVGMTPAETARDGQTTIDGLETLYDGVFAAAHKGNLIAGIDDFLEPNGGIESLADTLRSSGTAVTPCLSAMENEIALDTRPDGRYPHEQYVARSQRSYRRPLSSADLAMYQAMIPRLRTTVALLQRSGVTILAGTDFAAFRVPGFSLQDELEDLAASGLTPLQVLQAATSNPAKVMGLTADYGTIQPHRIADMVLLDGDPTKNSAALRQISGVILHGRLLDKQALEAELQSAEALASAH